MNLKKFLTALLVLTGISLATALAFAYKGNRYSSTTYPGYDSIWKKVDSCEQKGLTESARKYVLAVYTLARKENNAPQLVKALIYRMKYNHEKEENANVLNIQLLNEELKTASFPAKPILHSLLGEAYWDYFEQNRWRFYDRSVASGINDNDPETYDLKTIVGKTLLHYRASLQNTEALKKNRIDDFEHILEKGSADARALRPTLYDFLAHRALDVLMNSEAGMNTPGPEQFNLNNAVYLKPYNDFMNYTVPLPPDSLNLKYQALKIMQELLQFHAGEGNQNALADAELKRLNFIKTYSNNTYKDSLYKTCLQWEQKHFTDLAAHNAFKHLEALWWVDQSDNYRPLEGEAHKWDKKNAATLCQQIADTKDTSLQVVKKAKNTLTQLNTQTLRVVCEEVLEPNAPNRALVTYANAGKLYCRILKIPFRTYTHLRRNKHGSLLRDELVKLPQFAAFETALPNDQDYNAHSTEIALPALPAGHYVLLASLNAGFNFVNNTLSYQPLVVSDLAYISKSSQGSTQVYVVNRNSGQPIEGASVRTFVYNYDYNSDHAYKPSGQYTSNKQGLVQLAKTGNGNYFMEVSKDKDTLFPTASIYTNDYEGEPETQRRSVIFTDRAIYRPGQTIYFKLIAFEGDKNNFKAKAGKQVNVALYDVNDQKVSEQTLTTNQYGSVAGAFAAPQGVLNGQMHLSDGIASQYISVEEYKRPKFEVRFDTLKATTHLDENLTVKGFAKAYAGNVIDGAKVNYRVVRRVNYPYWFYWFRPFVQRGGEAEIANGSTVTKADGSFEIPFTALADPTVSRNDAASFDFEVSADVTDINGETRSGSLFVRAGYKQLELFVNVQDVNNTQQAVPASVTAQNLNGVPVVVAAQLNLYRLNAPRRVFRERLWQQPDKQVLNKDEYYKKFPNDLYADELNKYTWERGASLFSKTIQTNAPGNALEGLKKLEPGEYCLEAVCKDNAGEEVKALKYFTLYNPSSPTPPYPMAVWQVPLKVMAEPGEKAAFVLASSFSNVNCLQSTESEGRQSVQTILPTTRPIEIAVEEKDRGGIQCEALFVKLGRFYRNSTYIMVPYTNKEINIEFSTFRDKLLPGAQEEWKITLKNRQGEKLAAELLASMYDASLDALSPHGWNSDLYWAFSSRQQWQHSLERQSHSQQISAAEKSYFEVEPLRYDALNYFGYKNWGWGSGGGAGPSFTKFKHVALYDAANADDAVIERESYAMSSPAVAGMAAVEKIKFLPPQIKDDAATETNKVQANAPIATRKNFNETAFFFPQLTTNAAGDVVLKFTMPESLTRWKLMTLAHTANMMLGSAQKECVTQKDLMVIPNPPRFLRQGDQFTFSGKIANLSGKTLSGTAELRLFDPFTEKDITTALLGSKPVLLNFEAKAGQSARAEWNLVVPQDLQAVKYKITARAGAHTDGEEMALAVLSNRMLVTETLPLPVRGAQSKDFNFAKFIHQNNNSTTLKNHAYTIEFTANPAWYAVQSLPYLMEYPYECAEQVFSRYYANALATHIANSKPQIKQVFERWKNQSPESFLSNLEKNQELKALVLQETPWVLQAKNESENKKRLGLLFDLNHMGNELNMALNKLEKMQTPNGGWPWFEGCPEDWYISQHIATGLAHLQKLGVLDLNNHPRLKTMSERAVAFCDAKFAEAFSELKRSNKTYQNTNNLGTMQIHYLYMRSFYRNIALSAPATEAYAYYKKQSENYWTSNGRSLQARIALYLHRDNAKKTANNIVKSLKQNALNSAEMGMYWKENYGGYYWYQAPIETQALMIEVFDEVAGDAKSVDDLKTWLIKSKQTQHWGTTRATAEAIYALLLKGSNWLSTETDVEVKLGDVVINPKTDATLKTEAGTGYFKKNFTGPEIKPAMGKITVSKKNQGVAWGSAYWQYFEQLDKITPHATPLKLSRALFVVKNTAAGPVLEPVAEGTQLKVGDKLKVRIELRSDRDLEYLHLKDTRAAGLEPLNVLSGYRWQDGLGYYESTGDAASNFFISYLPKGTYVFEYPVIVSHRGEFSGGISSIQCMYAPEFSSHSQGMTLRVQGN